MVQTQYAVQGISGPLPSSREISQPSRVSGVSKAETAIYGIKKSAMQYSLTGFYHYAQNTRIAVGFRVRRE
jgi:hypothetical protein